MLVIHKFGLQFNVIIFILLLLILGVIGKFLILKTGNKKVYVFIYAFVVLFLLFQAVLNYNNFPERSTLYFLIGVILFALSDYLLAYNRFIKKFSNSQFFILSTYYIAQLLIAFSI